MTTRLTAVLIGLCLVMGMMAISAYAQEPFTDGLQEASNTAGSAGLSTATDILPVITDVIVWLLRFAALLSIGAIVWGGIMYIMSLGNESKAEKAKEVIKYAIIGVIVIMLSYAIIAFIQARLALVNPLGATIAYAADGFGSELDAFGDKASDLGLSKDTDVFPLIGDIIQWLLAFSAIATLGVIVWGGIMYILSLGDEGKAEKAKKIVLFAVIGLAIVLLSYVIVDFVRDRLVEDPFVFLVPTAYAVDTDTSSGFNSGIDAINNTVKPAQSGLATDSDVLSIILRVVNFLLALVAVLALAAIVWGAIMYILALGDESKAEKAKKIVLYAIIGVLLAGVSFLILSVVESLLVGP